MLVDDFFDLIITKAPLQKKNIDKMRKILTSVITEVWEEHTCLKDGGGGYLAELESLLDFFMEEYGCGLEKLVDCYIFLNNSITEEYYHFVQNHFQYRYNNFEQINLSVYSQGYYMEKYMCGLELSSYLWSNHHRILRFFDQNCACLLSDKYLEIGVGFGLYLDRISNYNVIKKYVVCDVSLTSINKCKKFMNYKKKNLPITYICQDACTLESSEKFDSIVMGEVLEHVENPLTLLQMIYRLLNDNGFLYITTAINAPTVDHIYLFQNREQISEMLNLVGFEIYKEICAPANDIEMRRAEKKKLAISWAAFLRKRKV